MPQDVRFVLPNRPGAAAIGFGALADAGINILAGSGDLRPGETWGFMHVLVDSGDDARAVLEEAGFEVTGVMDVSVHDIDDRPGSLLELCKSYGDDGDNVEVLYSAGNRRWVIGTESMRTEIPGRRLGDS
jgi:hypothetical protein